jgi:D-amino peptidase
MKIFIVTDMEGVSGCTCGGYGKSLSDARKDEYKMLMTGEINAAVQGCIDGGVEEIIVGESHYMNLNDLHADAKLARGIPWEDCMKLRDFSAIIFVGQHAMSNLSEAVRSHTGSSNSIIDFKVNEKPVGELALFGALAGERNIPVIFLSGDTAACKEAQQLISGPVTTVEVMESHSVHGAVCLSPAKAQAKIREGVCKSLKNIEKIIPITFRGKVTMEVEFRYSAVADDFSKVPGAIRVNPRTVKIIADDYESAYRNCYSMLGSILVRYDS